MQRVRIIADVEAVQKGNDHVFCFKNVEVEILAEQVIPDPRVTLALLDGSPIPDDVFERRHFIGRVLLEMDGHYYVTHATPDQAFNGDYKTLNETTWNLWHNLATGFITDKIQVSDDDPKYIKLDTYGRKL